MTPPDPNVIDTSRIDSSGSDDILPPDDGKPVFDIGLENLPWPPEDVLPMDDDGNILPGEDTLDDDPNDNGDREQNDPEDHNNVPV